MTKKHYIAIASILKSAYDTGACVEYMLSTYFESIDKNFKPEKFLAGCGLYEKIYEK